MQNRLQSQSIRAVPLDPLEEPAAAAGDPDSTKNIEADWEGEQSFQPRTICINSPCCMTYFCLINLPFYLLCITGVWNCVSQGKALFLQQTYFIICVKRGLEHTKINS